MEPVETGAIDTNALSLIRVQDGVIVRHTTLVPSAGRNGMNVGDVRIGPSQSNNRWLSLGATVVSPVNGGMVPYSAIYYFNRGTGELKLGHILTDAPSKNHTFFARDQMNPETEYWVRRIDPHSHCFTVARIHKGKYETVWEFEPPRDRGWEARTGIDFPPYPIEGNRGFLVGSFHGYPRGVARYTHKAVLLLDRGKGHFEIVNVAKEPYIYPELYYNAAGNRQYRERDPGREVTYFTGSALYEENGQQHLLIPVNVGDAHTVPTHVSVAHLMQQLHLPQGLRLTS